MFEKKTPYEVKKPKLSKLNLLLVHSMGFYWCLYLLNDQILTVFKLVTQCARSNSGVVGQKSDCSHWARLNTWVRENLSLIRHQSLANMNNFSLNLKAEPGFYFGTSLLIERNTVWAPPPSSSAGQRSGPGGFFKGYFTLCWTLMEAVVTLSNDSSEDPAQVVSS